jgi:hypothetical protein
VIQEVSLASKTPIVLAGGAWSYFESFITFHTILTSRPETSIIVGQVFRALNRPSFLHMIKEWHQESEPPSRELFNRDSSRLGADLESLLLATGGDFEAKLPHDHIYGLLGLLGSGTLPSPLVPDYSKPASQVYQDYSQFIISNTKNLSILLRYGNTIMGSPSWVSDFRSESAIWRASRVSSNSISFSEDGNQMAAVGVRLGICTHKFVPFIRRNLVQDAIFSDVMQLFDQFTSEASTFKHVSKDEVLEELIALRKKALNLEHSIKDLREFYYSAKDGLGMAPEQQKACVRDIMEFLLLKFTSFLTESGIFAASYRLDQAAQLGDVMVAVQGASKPLLLRPSHVDGEYVYLGYCEYKRFEYNDVFSNQVLKQFVLI